MKKQYTYKDFTPYRYSKLSQLNENDFITALLEIEKAEKQAKLYNKPMHTCGTQPNKMPYYGGVTFYEYLHSNIDLVSESIGELHPVHTMDN